MDNGEVVITLPDDNVCWDSVMTDVGAPETKSIPKGRVEFKAVTLPKGGKHLPIPGEEKEKEEKKAQGKIEEFIRS